MAPLQSYTQDNGRTGCVLRSNIRLRDSKLRFKPSSLYSYAVIISLFHFLRAPFAAPLSLFLSG